MRSARSTRASGRRLRRGDCASLNSTRRSPHGRSAWRRSPRPRRRSNHRATFSPRSRLGFEARRPKRREAPVLSRLSAASGAGALRRSPRLLSPACWLLGSLRARRVWRSAPHEYVAILQKDAASPAFAVTVNLDKQELTVRPVAATAPPGKSYELWLIDAKLGPRSLGVIGDTPRGASLSAYDPSVVEGATYAVTVEPPGGSPTGQPSGAPVFVGKLIPVGP